MVNKSRETASVGRATKRTTIGKWNRNGLEAIVDRAGLSSGPEPKLLYTEPNQHFRYDQNRNQSRTENESGTDFSVSYMIWFSIYNCKVRES